MGLPNEIHPFLITGNDANQFKVANSLRFRASATAYLSRTNTTSSNRTTWTWSGWVKKCKNGAYQMLLVAGSGSTNYCNLYFDQTADRIEYYNANGGSNSGYFLTTGISYRDPSAWYHIILAVDTTASAGSRAKLYVNGSQVNWTVNTDMALNYNTWVNSANTHQLCRDLTGASQYLDGYLAEVNFIDGQALTPSSFGAYDTNGVWQPKAYTGTYSGNSFYLPFSDNSSGTNVLTGNVGLGKDFSGLGNFWTTNNVSLAGSSYTSYTSGSGTYTVPAGITSINYLVVGGGGGGAYFGGGGGGGGVLAGQLSVTPGQTISYSVGGGGNGSTSNGTDGTNGTSSTFGSVTALGGGGGGSSTTNGVAGGSGGGGSRLGTGGAGTTGQGFAGGNGTTNGSTYFNAGGGGGATAVGGNAIAVAGNTQGGGTGGAGYTWINGSVYSGGGGGGGYGANGGPGGSGGGGSGGGDFNTNTVGTANTGGGGGGGKSGGSGSNGGSGIVIVSVGGGTTYDSMIDSPTNYADGGNGRGNYATLNPVNNPASSTIVDGNLGFTTATNTGGLVRSTIAVSSGKWYCEFSPTSSLANEFFVGIDNITNPTGSAENYVLGTNATSYAYRNSGNKQTNGSAVAYGASFTTNDVIAIALDLDNGAIYFGKQTGGSGSIVWQNSGDPTSGASKTGAAFTGLSGTYTFGCNDGTNVGGITGWVNFGQRPFSYTPPAGFKALNSFNLPNPSLPLV